MGEPALQALGKVPDCLGQGTCRRWGAGQGKWGRGLRREGPPGRGLPPALTGDGPQNIRDEDLHQALVQHIVTVLGPLKHRLELGKEHQTGPGQPLLCLIMPVRNPPNPQSRACVISTCRGYLCPDPGDSHGQRWCLIRLAEIVSPEGLPQCFYECELEIHHDVHDGLQGQEFAPRNGKGPAWGFLPKAEGQFAFKASPLGLSFI